VLAMLISQQNQLLHTFPRTIFSIKNFTMGGYSCMPDKIPIDRRISYPLASNLYKVCASALFIALCWMAYKPKEYAQPTLLDCCSGNMQRGYQVCALESYEMLLHSML
jgi:hypothetical protein